MKDAPTFEDIFAVMSSASVGDMAARVALSEASSFCLDRLTSRNRIAASSRIVEAPARLMASRMKRV